VHDRQDSGIGSCIGAGGAAGITETKHKNHSNSAQQKSVNQVCILKVHSYQSFSLFSSFSSFSFFSSVPDHPRLDDDDDGPKVRKLATYINALGTGELLPRSGDFFGSGAISPHHTTTNVGWLE
jgi:hypothetical protein